MHKRILRSRAGVTLIEMLIALMLTGVLTTAAFKFYQASHGEALVQQDISDLHLVCRNTVYDIKKTLRLAGYKVGSHKAYEFFGDTLCIYMQGTNPIDTIRYYLADLPSAYMPDNKSRAVYELRKQINSDPYNELAEYISAVDYNVIDSANIEVTVTAEAERKDPDYDLNNGYRTCSLKERVKIRNVR